MSTETSHSNAAAGWVIFAAAVMFIVGAIDIIQGLAALLKTEVFVVPASGLMVTTDYNTWGWMLIVWGIVMILASASLFGAGQVGRWIALIATVVNIIGQAAWFTAYPLWSLVVIGISVAVIWALTAGWQDVRATIRS